MKSFSRCAGTLAFTNRGLQPGDLFQMFLTPEARKEWGMNLHGKNQDKGKRGGEGWQADESRGDFFCAEGERVSAKMR